MPVYVSVSLGLIVLGVTAVVAYKVGRLVEQRKQLETASKLAGQLGEVFG
jgi:hypothetical protein